MKRKYSKYFLTTLASLSIFYSGFYNSKGLAVDNTELETVISKLPSLYPQIVDAFRNLAEKNTNPILLPKFMRKAIEDIATRNPNLGKFFTSNQNVETFFAYLIRKNNDNFIQSIFKIFKEIESIFFEKYGNTIFPEDTKASYYAVLVRIISLLENTNDAINNGANLLKILRSDVTGKLTSNRLQLIIDTATKPIDFKSLNIDKSPALRNIISTFNLTAADEQTLADAFKIVFVKPLSVNDFLDPEIRKNFINLLKTVQDVLARTMDVKDIKLGNALAENDEFLSQLPLSLNLDVAATDELSTKLKKDPIKLTSLGNLSFDKIFQSRIFGNEKFVDFLKVAVKEYATDIIVFENNKEIDKLGLNEGSTENRNIFSQLSSIRLQEIISSSDIDFRVLEKLQKLRRENPTFSLPLDGTNILQLINDPALAPIFDKEISKFKDAFQNLFKEEFLSGSKRFVQNGFNSNRLANVLTNGLLEYLSYPDVLVEVTKGNEVQSLITELKKTVAFKILTALGPDST